MEDVTVACGCGRKMTLDALRGRGAYRCGCGVRVKVATSRDENRCAAVGCRLVVASKLTTAKLCAEHEKRLLLECLPLVLVKYPIHDWVGSLNEYRRLFGEMDLDGLEWIEERNALRPIAPVERIEIKPVVYFIELGEQVKIGTTTDLRLRIASLQLPPAARTILTLDGSYDLEARLHRQFADERLGRSEWFTLSPRILDFVEAKKKSAPSSGTRGSKRLSLPTT